MTVNDLIKKLDAIENKDKVCIISDGSGWCNIDGVLELESTIAFNMEKFPIFSDN